MNIWNLLSRLKRRKEKTHENKKQTVRNGSKMIPITNIVSFSDKTRVVAQSEVPECVAIGNLVYERKYDEAIEMGLRFLEKTPKDAGVHINLMDAYFKGRKDNPDFLERSTYHAKLAILCGHNTGYAEKRLVKNLEMEKKYYQALQLYDLILNTEGFHFSEHGRGNYIDWEHRKNVVLGKIDKAVDSEQDILFTQSEKERIVNVINVSSTNSK